ncbi:MAG: PAS domain S-box protein, partial [Candidatus Omnitrophota bacterium]
VVIFETSGVPLLDAAGKLIGYRGVDRDITQRRWAEEEYKTILRTSIDGFWIVDAQGRFLEVNDAYCRMIGYSREELSKMSIPDIEAVERPEETMQRIQKIMKVGESRFETRHKRKDGKFIDIEVSATYTKEGGGRLFVFVRDITDRKKIEEEQRALMKDLEETNRIMVGRELRMIELKKEVNKLTEEIGRPKPHEVDS